MDIHTNSVPVKPQRSERKFLLSEILGSKVFLHEKKIGTLSDLMIVETGRIPEVVNFVITRPFGDPPLLVPYERFVTLEPHQLVIDSDDLKKLERSPPEDAILLRDHILDKKVLDTEDAEVEVVYDIRLVERNAKLYVTEVDTSKAARLRRLPPGRPRDGGRFAGLLPRSPRALQSPAGISSDRGAPQDSHRQDPQVRVARRQTQPRHPVITCAAAEDDSED